MAHGLASRTVEEMTGRQFERSIADVPAQLQLWDIEANAVDPAAVGARSSRPRFWRCAVAQDHRWQAAPSAITRSLEKGYTGCPCCAGRQLSVTNSFAARHPEGVELWHPHRNGAVTPHEVLAGSPETMWWQCPAGHDHEWQASPLVIGKNALSRGNTGCPFCAGKRASATNSVAAHSLLSLEWHPTANGDLRPDRVVAGSQRKVWWRCRTNPEHEWRATCANRSRGRGCPHCKKSLRSIGEVGLAFELQVFFPDLDLEDDKVVLDGSPVHVDLILREQGVVIEVDGRYHHTGAKAHDRDRRKSAQLQAAGYRTLRVREAPLSALNAPDVVVPTDATIKQTSDAVLIRLDELGWAAVPDLAKYLARREPLRQDEALAAVRAARPGKSVRLPGPAAFRRDDRWADGLAVLQAYVTREGHARVPYEHVEAGYKLGTWVGAKRSQYRKGRMNPARQQQLEALPGWTWDAPEDVWETGFAHFLDFARTEGHQRVPVTYTTADGFPLGSWVRSHRRPGGGRKTMTTGQRDRLEAVPGWSYGSAASTFWEDAYEALLAFSRREGHCRTLRGCREDGINIDAWSKQQRARFHRGDLGPERVGRLQEVPGWSWAPQDDAWEAGFAALTEHVRQTGTTGVSQRVADGAYPVGVWAGEQRNRHRRGELDAPRVSRLESLPGWSWDPHSDSWEHHFQALLRFVDRDGHAEVPTGHFEDDLPLSAWVIRHRQEYKAGRVRQDRVRRLETLPGWTWDVLESRWQENYARLVAYAAREGHLQVPGGYIEDGHRLGSWVLAQRRAGRAGALPPARHEQLQSTPGWTWTGR